MGEYALRKSDRQRVKIGTCEDMFYCRFEDRAKFDHLQGNVDTLTDTGLRWRLPLPEEDGIEPGNYNNHQAHAPLINEADRSYYQASDLEPGNIQLTHPSGLLLNVPCHHGEKLPEVGPQMRAFWNGKGYSMVLAAIKNLADGRVVPIISCRHCGHMWRSDWEDIWAFIPKTLRLRLEAYRESCVTK